MANSMYLKHHISAIKFWNENYITGLLTLLLLTLITRNRQPFSAPPRFRSPSTCPPPQGYMLKKLWSLPLVSWKVWFEIFLMTRAGVGRRRRFELKIELKFDSWIEKLDWNNRTFNNYATSTCLAWESQTKPGKGRICDVIITRAALELIELSKDRRKSFSTFRAMPFVRILVDEGP